MQRMLSSDLKPIFKLLLTGVCAGIILLCSCPWTVYYRTIDYTSPNLSATSRSEEISQLCANFLSAVQADNPQRFIFVCDASQPYEYEDQVYLQYLSVPSSVYTLSLTEEYLAENSLRQTMTELLADYDAQQIYFFNLSQSLLDTIAPDSAVQNGEFYSPEALMQILP